LPKPSIDPGRKSPGPIVIPKPTATPPDTAASAPAGQGQWLKYDAASKTVTFELIAGPFNFNGYTSGGATLVIPGKANVVMNFVNKDGTPHSAQIISGEGPLPNAAVEAAIPRAYTNKVLEGLPQEGSDVMRFTVPESGSYRIFCGVPGHGLSGMWIWMKVDPSAKTPSFGPTKA
jgi:sulfocyanin